MERQSGKIPFLNEVIKVFRQYFVAGLLTLIPITLTVWLILLIVGWINAIILLIPTKLGIEDSFLFRIPGMGMVLAFALICSAGFLARNFIGNWVLKKWNYFIYKVPFVGTIYNAITEMVKNMLGDRKGQYNRVVMIPYPTKGLWALAFVTNEQPATRIMSELDEPYVHVFVPTSPNPTSGFFLVVPKKEIKPLDMPIDEAFKIIVSGGMAST